MLAATTERVTYHLSANVLDSKFLLSDKVIQLAILIPETEYTDMKISENFTR